MFLCIVVTSFFLSFKFKVFWNFQKKRERQFSCAVEWQELMRCDFILTHENLDILGIEVLSLGYCNTIALKGITCAKKLTFMLNLENSQL